MGTKNNSNLRFGHYLSYLINFLDGLTLSHFFFKELFLESFRHHYEKTKPFMKEELLSNGFMGKSIL